MIEESYQEYLDEFYHIVDPDETFDEDKVLIYAIPLDEDIKAYAYPAHQEENMMSCDPFEKLDDVIFHESRSEEALEDPSNMTYPFKKGQKNTLQ
jgi:hypothetical protein